MKHTDHSPTALLAPVAMNREEKLFLIEADMVFLTEGLNPDSSHVFTPVLYDEKNRLELPSIVVSGSSRYLSFFSSLWGVGKKMREYRKYYHLKKILKAGRSSSINYLYRIKLDYEPWMEYADLRFV